MIPTGTPGLRAPGKRISGRAEIRPAVIPLPQTNNRTPTHPLSMSGNVSRGTLNYIYDAGFCFQYAAHCMSLHFVVKHRKNSILDCPSCHDPSSPTENIPQWKRLSFWQVSFPTQPFRGLHRRRRYGLSFRSPTQADGSAAGKATITSSPSGPSAPDGNFPSARCGTIRSWK